MGDTLVVGNLDGDLNSFRCLSFLPETKNVLIRNGQAQTGVDTNNGLTFKVVHAQFLCCLKERLQKIIVEWRVGIENIFFRLFITACN